MAKAIGAGLAALGKVEVGLAPDHPPRVLSAPGGVAITWAPDPVTSDGISMVCLGARAPSLLGGKNGYLGTEFPLPAGTSYEIDGLLGYDGTGRALERTDRVLKIRLDLPSWGPAPAFHGTIMVEYRQEGPGNTVVLEGEDGEVKRDDGATMRSVDNRHERAITSHHITCSIRYVDAV